MRKFLYAWEIGMVTGCHTWYLLGQITCGSPNAHAQAMIEIWAAIMEDALRADQGLELTLRIGTMRTSIDSCGHVSFLSCEKGAIVYMADAPMFCRMEPPGDMESDGN